MARKIITTGTPWETQVGYSRALRVGDHVYVAGTTSTDASNNFIGQGNAYEQTKQVIRNISSALDAAGATLEHVVRTRIYVTDISLWAEIGRAHQEAFGSIQPASTMVEVSKLVHPDMLVEIEVDALIST